MIGLAAVLAQRTYESSDPPGWFLGGFFVVWGVMMLGALAGYGFGIWSLVEILRYRDDEFAALGKNRTTWLVLQIVGLLVCQIGGAVVAILFLWKHRPELRAWREAHPVQPWYPQPYGAPPGYGGPPPGYPTYGSPPPPGYPPQAWAPPPPPPPPPPSSEPAWPGSSSEWQPPTGWEDQPGEPSTVRDRPPAGETPAIDPWGAPRSGEGPPESDQ